MINRHTAARLIFLPTEEYIVQKGCMCVEMHEKNQWKQNKACVLMSSVCFCFSVLLTSDFPCAVLYLEKNMVRLDARCFVETQKSAFLWITHVFSCTRADGPTKHLPAHATAQMKRYWILPIKSIPIGLRQSRSNDRQWLQMWFCLFTPPKFTDSSSLEAPSQRLCGN